MTISSGLGGMTALLFDGQRSSGFGPQWRRRRVLRSGASQARSRTAWAHAGAAHDGLSRTNGAAINRLAGNWRGTASRHAGPRCLRLRLAGSGTRLRLLQPRHHVRTRRNHGTRDRLARQCWPGLSSQRQSGRWHAGRGRRRGSCSQRCRRWRRSRGQRLARARKNLAGARSRGRRRGGPGRNGSGSQRRMQWRASPGCQRWPYWRGFHTRGFFGAGVIHSVGVIRRGRFRNRSGCTFGRLFSNRRCGRGLFFFGWGFLHCHRSSGMCGQRFTTCEAPANLVGHGLVYRTGMRFLLRDAELRQHVDQGMGGDLELPGQLVDADFAHSYCNTLETGRLTDLLRVLYSIRFDFQVR